LLLDADVIPKKRDSSCFTDIWSRDIHTHTHRYLTEECHHVWAVVIYRRALNINPLWLDTHTHTHIHTNTYLEQCDLGSPYHSICVCAYEGGDSERERERERESNSHIAIYCIEPVRMRERERDWTRETHS